MLTPPLLNVIDVKTCSAPCTPKSTSSSDSGKDTCFICMSSGESSPRSVCGCKNTVAHVKCIEKWVNAKPEFSMECEVCLQPYTVEWRFKEEKNTTVRPQKLILLPMIFGVGYGASYIYFMHYSPMWTMWLGNASIISSWLGSVCLCRQHSFHKKYLLDDIIILFTSYAFFLVVWFITNLIVARNSGNIGLHSANAHICNTVVLMFTTCTRTVCIYCDPRQNAV